MAKGKNEAKIRFTAETSDFNKAVSDANQSLSALAAELKLNATQMKDSSDDADLLADRKKMLGEQLEAAASKTEALRKKMEVAASIYGENSTEAQRLRRQIALAATEEERIRQEITKVNTALEAQSEESGKTKKAMEKLEDTISDQESAMQDLKDAYADAVLTYGQNSKEANNLAKEIRDLGSELNDNRAKMSKAQSAADKLEQATEDAGDAAEEANDGFTIWKGTLADLSSNAIQGALSGIQGLASSFWNLGDETRELRTNMAKVETAFESAGFTTEQAASTYEHFYGVLADEGQATEAASLLSKLAKNEEQLAEYTEIATGIYAEFGDSLPIEGLIEAANETAKTGSVTGSLADALNWSTMSSEEWVEAFNGHPRALKKFQAAMKKGVTVEEAFNEALTECNEEWEKEQVIRQALNGLYGDAAAAYAENNAEIIEANKAQARYNDSLAGLGSIIEPIKTVFMNGMAGMLESVTELISGLDTETIKASIQGAFDYINNTVFPAIKTGIQWFIDNKDLVVAGLTAIVAGMAAFKIVSIVQTAIGIFKGFQAATQGLTIAQKALNLVMKANPIGLVIAGIAALVAGFIYLWNNCEGFRNFWIGLWDNIKYYAGVALDWLVNFFTVTLPESWNSFKTFASELWSQIWSSVSTWAMNIWTSVTTWFSNMWTSLNETVGNIWTSVTTWFSNIWASVSSTAMNIWTSVTTWFNNLWTSIVSVVTNIWTSVTTWFSNIKTTVTTTAMGIWTSVTSWFTSIWTSLTGTVSNIWNTVTSKFTEIKDGVVTTVTGLWSSVTSKFTALWNSVQTIATNIWTSLTEIWTGIKTTISGVWDGIKSGVIQSINSVRSTVSNVFENVKSKVSSIWESIKTNISGVWDGIKSGVVQKINSVRSTVTGVFDSVKSTVSNIWENIKTSITDKIDSAKSTVSSVLDSIKGLFDFEFKWPKLPMPHFSVTGSINPLDWFDQGVPKLSVEWYAKGGILENPTLFGMQNGKLLGGGEAGAEAVAPIDVLLGYVREAVSDVMSAMTFNVDAFSNVDKLETYLNSSSNDMGRLIDAIEGLASRAIEINIDSKRVATATASASDNVSGNRLNLKTRGLAIR